MQITLTRKIEHYENGVLTRVEYEYPTEPSNIQGSPEENRRFQQTTEASSRPPVGPTRHPSQKKAHKGRGAYKRRPQARQERKFRQEDQKVPLTTSGHSFLSGFNR
jgi:hypothetical protein